MNLKDFLYRLRILNEHTLAGGDEEKMYHMRDGLNESLNLYGFELVVDNDRGIFVPVPNARKADERWLEEHARWLRTQQDNGEE